MDDHLTKPLDLKKFKGLLDGFVRATVPLMALAV